MMAGSKWNFVIMSPYSIVIRGPVSVHSTADVQNVKSIQNLKNRAKQPGKLTTTIYHVI